VFDYSLDHLFSYTVSVEKPQMIGPIPEGIRAIFYVISGEIAGPKLRGRFLPGGGDWLTVRTDGVGILDIRGTLESDDGARAHISWRIGATAKACEPSALADGKSHCVPSPAASVAQLPPRAAGTTLSVPRCRQMIFQLSTGS